MYSFWEISGTYVNSLFTGCPNIFDQPSELPLSYPASPLNVPPCQYVFSFPKKDRFDPKLTRKRGRKGTGREDSPRVISPPLEFHSAPRCEGTLSPTGLHSWSRKRKGKRRIRERESLPRRKMGERSKIHRKNTKTTFLFAIFYVLNPRTPNVAIKKW